MFYLTKPKDEDISIVLKAAETEKFTYAEVGKTFDHPPEGYNIDHNRELLGNGREAFDRAKSALGQWKMFDMPWVKLCRQDADIKTGQNVAILIEHFGFYSINTARIVYVIDEDDRFGFAYGTLENHGEMGEERFSVEFNADTGEVWYDLFAFSRPNHLMAKLGYPVTRYLQRCFAKDSKAAMARNTR